jgi:hypothetical protein
MAQASDEVFEIESPEPEPRVNEKPNADPGERSQPWDLQQRFTQIVGIFLQKYRAGDGAFPPCSQCPGTQIERFDDLQGVTVIEPQRLSDELSIGS